MANPRLDVADVARYRRVPNEILVEIFYHLFASMDDPIVDYMTFKKKKGFNWLLCLSKEVSTIVLEAYYRSQYFIFVKTLTQDSCQLRGMGLMLPPTHVRHFLRRMNIMLVLSNVCPDHGSGKRPVADVNDLLKHGEGWKTLKFLTDSNVGFSCLQHLSLHLCPTFAFTETWNTEGSRRPNDLYDLIRQANITVRADKIYLYWYSFQMRPRYSLPAIKFQAKTGALQGPLSTENGCAKLDYGPRVRLWSTSLCCDAVWIRSIT
ncbi:hypothetical protein BDV96DRAFT_654988 [Lophiotrema nucula]|uniref:F-box domain-containing protein n=1 Tax=Lophiotrema nucula TaxID=690887 RepID=A0A6A5YGB8_9PLEO|nr:hypothetical protein BDV96DRAFT_654988 [Lophiotrema nucula]